MVSQSNSKKNWFHLSFKKFNSLKPVCKKIQFRLQNILFIYNLKRNKNIWFHNYQKKKKLRNEKNIKQNQIGTTNLLTSLLWYRRHKNKTTYFNKKWHYHRNDYDKKIQLKYYQNNFLNFYNTKHFYRFFLNLPFYKKTKLLYTYNVFKKK